MVKVTANEVNISLRICDMLFDRVLPETKIMFDHLGALSADPRGVLDCIVTRKSNLIE